MKSKNRARIILWTVLMLALIACVIIAWIHVLNKNKIYIDELGGNVRIQQKMLENKFSTDAEKGMSLENGDRVIVPSDGFARAALGENGYIYLESDSDTVFSYEPDSFASVSLTSGSVSVSLSDSAEITVSANDLSVWGKGSAFTVGLSDEQEYVLCADGEVIITQNGVESETLSAGQQISLSGENNNEIRDADTASLPKSALTGLMRLAAQRETAFSMNSLCAAYYNYDSAYGQADEILQKSEASEESETTALPAESETESASETTSAPVSEETEASGNEAQETQTAFTTQEAWRETEITEAVTQSTTYENEDSEYTSTGKSVSETASDSETDASVAEVKPQETTSTIPWWEIINSANSKNAD